MGRLTKDPEVRYSNKMAIARYSLAVDRRRTSNEEQNTDFINIVAFGKSGEFAEKYLHKGTKVLVTGRIQTGSYTNKDGVKIYTSDVVAEDQEFAESKNSGVGAKNGVPNETEESHTNGFMNIPEGMDEELPFASPTR